jgi:hypothetical protein
MKPILIFRKKTSETEHIICYNEYHFWGFIAHKKAFTHRWFNGIIPFADNLAAWHFFGFRFTKTHGYVSKHRDEISGWHTYDKVLIKKLRSL